jgi:hypothetical protein
MFMITMYPGGSSLFGAFPIMFFAVFALAFLIIAGSIIQNMRQRHKDDHAPRRTAQVTVVAKRTHVWGDHSHTDYYVTFQLETGDRLELEVPDSRFGYLVEGDNGILTSQGSRFLSFERT